MNLVSAQEATLLANEVPLVEGVPESVELVFLLLDGELFGEGAEATREHRFYVGWLGGELGVQLAPGDAITLVFSDGAPARQSRVGRGIGGRPSTDEV